MKKHIFALVAVLALAAAIPASAQNLGSLPNKFLTSSNVASYVNLAGTAVNVTNNVSGLTNYIAKNATITTKDLFSVWHNPYGTNGAWVPGTNAGVIPFTGAGHLLSLDAQFTIVSNATNSTITFARSAASDAKASSVETAGTIVWNLLVTNAGTYNFHTNYDVGGDGQWQLQSWTVNNGAAGYVTNPVVQWRVR